VSGIGRGAARRLGAAASSLGLVIALTTLGCGVPDDGGARTIAMDDIPFGLADPSTTSTTTASSLASPPIDYPTTTRLAEPVLLFFARDADFVPVTRRLPYPVSVTSVIAALARGPQPGDEPPGIRSVIGPEDVENIRVRAGIASVELSSRLQELPLAEQRLAVAQLVLTLTDRPGIGQVLFTVNDEAVEVPRLNGSIARGPVSRDDYQPPPR
jgi:hypothetical protein